MKLFGLFYNCGGGITIERASNVIFIFLIASLNVHLLDALKEVLLLIAHLRIKATPFSYSPMVMKIGRIVLATGTPIGLQSLLNDLMAHKTNI